MEKKKKLGTGALAGIVALAVLSVLGLVSEFIGTIQNYSTAELVLELIPFCIVFLSVAYYTVAGYKKPHGNLLRNMFLLYSFFCAGEMIAMVFYANEHGYLNASFPRSISMLILVALCAVLTAFVAGRLDKIKKNSFLLALITAALIAVSLLDLGKPPFPHPVYVLWSFVPVFVWLDLIVAYVLRYREHKEAGLADK